MHFLVCLVLLENFVWCTALVPQVLSQFLTFFSLFFSFYFSNATYYVSIVLFLLAWSSECLTFLITINLELFWAQLSKKIKNCLFVPRGSDKKFEKKWFRVSLIVRGRLLMPLFCTSVSNDTFLKISDNFIKRQQNYAPFCYIIFCHILLQSHVSSDLAFFIVKGQD